MENRYCFPTTGSVHETFEKADKECRDLKSDCFGIRDFGCKNNVFKVCIQPAKPQFNSGSCIYKAYRGMFIITQE